MKNKRNYLIRVSLRKKIKSKWFIGINIFLFIIILLTVNINTIINMFGGDYKETKIINIKDNVDIYNNLEEKINNASKFSTSSIVVNRVYDSEEELIDNAKKNNNEIVLIIDRDSENIIGAKIYSNKGINDYIRNMISNSLNSIRYDMALNEANLSKEVMDRLNASVKIESIVLIEENNNKKQTNNQSNVIGVVAVIIFTMPFLFLLTTLVQMIGAEINEEKSTKAMEVIISNVEPKEHLIAKIISCTLFTIMQIFLLAIYIGIASLIRSKTGISIDTESNRLLNEIISNMISPSIVEAIVKILPLLGIFLIFTLITYAILAGVLASMTTNIDDFQQLQTPIMLTISIGFYLSIIASIFEGSTLIKVLSFFPLISFMLSPSLYMLQQVSLSAVIISTIIQIVFTYIIYKYGLRIYRVGILNYSGEHLWRKVFKALKK